MGRRSHYQKLVAQIAEKGTEMVLEGMPLTVLHRPGHRWLTREIAKLQGKYIVYGREGYPEYLILLEHPTKAEIQERTQSDWDFEVTYLIGMKNPKLPFFPRVQV